MLLQFRGTGDIHCPLFALGGPVWALHPPLIRGAWLFVPPWFGGGLALSLSSQPLAALHPAYLLRLPLGLLGLVLGLGLNVAFGLWLRIWEGPGIGTGLGVKAGF